MNAPAENKTVHYLEAFDHTELIERWVGLIASIAGVKVVCHVKPCYQESLRAQYSTVPNVSIGGPTEGISWPAYIRRIQFDSTSVAVIPTVGQRPHWFTSLISRVNFYLVLHNLNYWFDRSAYRLPRSTVKDLAKDVRQYIEIRAKRSLLTSSLALLYATDALAQEGMRETSLGNVNHLVLPFSCLRNSPVQITANADRRTLQVVVPGSMSSRARNYKLVLDGLAGAAGNDAMIDIHFAGKVVDQCIQRQFQEFVTERSLSGTNGIQLHWYNDGLDEQQFDAVLTSADVILAPLKPEVTVGRYIEKIGYTKASGTPFDAIYFGKPILLPFWHPLRDPAVLHFSDGTHLGDVLTNLAFNRELPKNCWHSNTEQALRSKWENLIKA
ncbi:hypothetical protein [Lewinella sp. IMCC34191]|uniref:hypothetical protein n=1 Tax=Lewinella sp. IMCC34191 TaxID=2259172 RepID=UPI000E26B125|nr:hypothetical protein [Lewinella sp. IMCC34191]